MKKKWMFTEWFLTVLILGISAVLFIPLLSSAIDDKDAAQCISNLKLIGTALEMYASDNNGILALVDENDKMFIQWNRMDRHWSVFLMMGGYIPLEKQKVFYCPSRRADPSGTEGSTVPKDNPEYKTYGMGLDVPQQWCVGKYVLDDTKGEAWSIYLKKNKIPVPSKYPMVCDTAADSNPWYGNLGEIMYFVRDYNAYPNKEGGPFTLHTGTLNILFADGHVSTLKGAELPYYGINHWIDETGTHHIMKKGTETTTDGSK